MTILIAARLAPHQLERHLEPLARSDLVGRIIVVRDSPIPERLPKVQNVTFRDGGSIRNLGRMYRTVRRVAREEDVDWLIGFNPVPWGTVGALAVRGQGVRTILSLIGRDFQQLGRIWASPIWFALRRADHITVTGARMRDELVRRGLPISRIRVLPHVVDTARFAPDGSTPDLDIVSVGQLIPRKRMDVLVEAVRVLRDRGLHVRAGILGRGPLENELRGQIERSGLIDQVELLGYREDVEVVLRRGRVYALASEWEGVPFALIEAMCAGLVPVVTDVGTISDWVEDNLNGRLVAQGDPVVLADALEEVLNDVERYESLRRSALSARSQLGLGVGVDFWETLFGVR